jgi:hypothetical protein
VGDDVSPEAAGQWRVDANQGGGVHPTQYRITVQGRLTDRLGSAFEDMTRRVMGGNTDLIGEIRDQSQLFGLLDRVRRLGLELISITPNPPEATAPHEAPPIARTQSQPHHAKCGSRQEGDK